MSLNIRCLMTFQSLPVWHFIILSMPLNTDVKKPKLPHQKPPKPFLRHQRKGKRSETFFWTRQNMISFHCSKAHYPCVFSTGMTILCSIPDTSSTVCTTVLSISRIYLLLSALCCVHVAVTISAQSAWISAEPWNIRMHASQPALGSDRNLHAVDAWKILGCATFLHSRCSCINLWSRLLEFVPEHKLPCSKSWS